MAERHDKARLGRNPFNKPGASAKPAKSETPPHTETTAGVLPAAARFLLVDLPSESLIFAVSAYAWLKQARQDRRR